MLLVFVCAISRDVVKIERRIVVRVVSVLWSIERSMRIPHTWPMVAEGLWHGQVYDMNEDHRWILLMTFRIHKYTMTRSWGPLLCYTFKNITSYCSMLQQSECNSWKTSQFLHGQHTNRTCHPLCIFGTLWIGVFVDQHSKSHNREPDYLSVNEMCCKWWSHQILTGLLSPQTPFNKSKRHVSDWPFIVASLRRICPIIMLSK